MGNFQRVIGLILILLSSSLWADSNSVTDPCTQNILSIFRRPTVLSGACTTPLGKFTLEGGLNYVEFIDNAEGYRLPQSKVRIGLPERSEVTIIFPNEITNNNIASGLTATQLTFKHNIYYNEHWNTAVRAVFIPASGSTNFGTAHNGYTVNGIVSYRINNFNAAFMLGYSSYSTPPAAGGSQYTTLSPDIVFGWQTTKWLQLYAEIYGQLKTAPTQGPGYNTDAGFLFLFNNNFEGDIEIGHRINGNLGIIKTFYGAGLSVLV